MAARIPIALEDAEHAESVLLGGMLLHPDVGMSVRAVLQTEDFTVDRHRLIYEAVLTAVGSSESNIVHTVSTLLTESELENIGGVSYLMFLKQEAEGAKIPVKEQAHLLKQAVFRRQLIQMGETICTHVAFDDDLNRIIRSLEQALSVAQQLLSPNNTLPQHIVSLQEVLSNYLEYLVDDNTQQGAVLTGIPTGFADLDVITGGLQRSDLVIIAGPPSIGKTGFALSIALHVLLHAKNSVGLFSLETSKRRVIQRLLSMEANLDQTLLRSLAKENEHWDQLCVAAETLMESKLWIDDTVSLTTTQLHDTARFLVERCGVELLIVDYVHLMLSAIDDKRHENRVQEIGEISRSLKALARELNIPVLALAQVSRAFESRPSKKLQLSDLRDGSLENDADLVLFLSVDEEHTTAAAACQLVTISIAKHRHGPRADLDVCFHPSSGRFRDLKSFPQASAPEQPSLSTLATSKQIATHPERLMDIMARIPKRQTKQEKPKPSSPRRELPRGDVIEDGEVDSESEPDSQIASLVDELG